MHYFSILKLFCKEISNSCIIYAWYQCVKLKPSFRMECKTLVLREIKTWQRINPPSHQDTLPSHWHTHATLGNLWSVVLTSEHVLLPRPIPSPSALIPDVVAHNSIDGVDELPSNSPIWQWTNLIRIDEEKNLDQSWTHFKDQKQWYSGIHFDK